MATPLFRAGVAGGLPERSRCRKHGARVGRLRGEPLETRALLAITLSYDPCDGGLLLDAGDQEVSSFRVESPAGEFDVAKLAPLTGRFALGGYTAADPAKIAWAYFGGALGASGQLDLGPVVPAGADCAELGLKFSYRVGADEFTSEVLCLPCDELGRIRGQNWHDLNADGLKAPGEPGLDGWVILLSNPLTGDIRATTTTYSQDLNGDGQINPDTESGLYSFPAVQPDAYYVSEAQPPGWHISYPRFERLHRVSVEPGQTYDYLDFGNWRPGSLAGVKFHDQNGNGVRDTGEPGLAGWTIVGTAGTGSWRKIGFEVVTRADDPLTDFDEEGLFSLGGLEPGHYWIREQLKEGWVQTAPLSGEYQFDLRSGESVDGLVFGNRRIDEPQLGSIQGQKWHDQNANGVHDSGEAGLDDWVILLDNPMLDGPPLTATTHSVDLNGDGQIDPATERGLYTFQHVHPARYFVYEVSQSGWKQSSPATGNYEVTLAAGQSINGLNFGNYRSAFLQGQKWHDRDGNGQRANDEPALDGWTILLIDARTGQVIDRQITRSEDTNGDNRLDPRSEQGFYRFEDLAPGSYLVMEQSQAGWRQSAPAAGTHLVELAAGQAVEHLDFGNWRPAAIHGTKFLDVDGDGTRDSAEAGLAGWTIVVEGTDGRGRPLRRQVVTSADDPATRVDEAGRYVIEDLPPGRYEVVERLLPGWQQTWPDGGVHRVELASDEVAGPLDFGNRPLLGGAVGGVKWHDLDSDGVRDPDEPGLAGWTIRITTLDLSPLPGVDRTTVTQADDPLTPENEAGRYRFDDLPLRPLWVQEISQPGWQQSAPSNGGHLVTLVEPGQVLEGLDFGNWQAAAVVGFKWFDRNGNAEREPNERGMSSVTIYSDLNGNNLLDPDEPRTMSQADDPHTDFDEAGHYRLEGLRPGKHIIREIAPGPDYQTYPLSGFHEVVLSSGQSAGSLDFGNLTLPGDINLDGRVDLTDFGLLKLNFGDGPRPAVVPGWRQGDFNGDLTVDLSDFGILKEHFGEQAPILQPSEDALEAAVDWALALLTDVGEEEDWEWTRGKPGRAGNVVR